MKIKNINRLKKYKNIKLVKTGICIGIMTVSMMIGGCNNHPEYYLVYDNQKSYICTRAEKCINYDDYDFVSIVDNQTVGSMCFNRDSFDYSKHHITTNFLNDFQVVPLQQVFDEQNLDDSIFSNLDELKRLATSDSLNNIKINYYTNLKYYFEQKFIYTEPSKLQLFVVPGDIIVGYNVSPDHTSTGYIYSIYDNDVLKYTKDDLVEIININYYLTDEQRQKGYLTYNESIELINTYINQNDIKKYVKK